MPLSWIFTERKPNDLFWTKNKKKYVWPSDRTLGTLLGVPEAWSDAPGPKCLSVGFSRNESRMTCFGLKTNKNMFGLPTGPSGPLLGVPEGPVGWPNIFLFVFSPKQVIRLSF